MQELCQGQGVGTSAPQKLLRLYWRRTVSSWPRMWTVWWFLNSSDDIPEFLQVTFLTWMLLRQKRAEDMKAFIHPKDLPNDPPGKASNVAYAFKQLFAAVSDCENVVLTIADADSEFGPGYFESVSCQFASSQSRYTIWQSPVFHMKNYHRQPAPVVVGTMFTSMQLGQVISIVVLTRSPSVPIGRRWSWSHWTPEARTIWTHRSQCSPIPLLDIFLANDTSKRCWWLGCWVDCRGLPHGHQVPLTWRFASFCMFSTHVSLFLYDVNIVLMKLHGIQTRGVSWWLWGGLQWSLFWVQWWTMCQKKPMTRLMKLLGGELAWHVGRSYNDMPWDSQTFRIISWCFPWSLVSCLEFLISKRLASWHFDASQKNKESKKIS